MQLHAWIGTVIRDESKHCAWKSNSLQGFRELAVQIYSVGAMGMTRTGHLLWCGSPPQIIPLKSQFIKMGKHKKGYFSLLLEEYSVTEGWVYWLMMDLASGFQERTQIQWRDNIVLHTEWWAKCLCIKMGKFTVKLIKEWYYAVNM